MAKRAFKLISRETGEPVTPPTKREASSIRQTLDELAVARCPLCHAMLIARMGRRGPGFFCECKAREKKCAA